MGAKDHLQHEKRGRTNIPAQLSSWKITWTIQQRFEKDSDYMESTSLEKYVDIA